MTTSEHLIENAITFFEDNKKLSVDELYDNFMNDKLIIAQAKEVGISMRDIWRMAQYIHCTYIPYIKNKTKHEMIKRYGYEVEE